MADSQATQTEAQQPAPGTIERIRPRQLSQRDPAGLARAAAASQFWRHIKSTDQALVIMAAGEELGLTPLAAFQGITIIEGKVGYTGNLIATLFRQHERYGYKIVERNDERCTLQFLEDGEPIDDGEEGKVTFTVDDARRAELVKPRSNWEKYPRAMCFNRALTEGARAYFPDITAGVPVYTDDEIREVIHVEAEVDQVQEAEVAPERLPDETLDRLMQGYEIAGDELGGHSRLDGLNILLGSLGMDGIDSEPDLDLREAMATWSPEQAAEVERGFQEALDRAAQQALEAVASAGEEEVDAEVVPDGEEATHADS